MAEARIARALNRLGEDSFLFASDGDSILELMDDYFDDAAPTGNPTYLMNTINKSMNIHNNNTKTTVDGNEPEPDEDVQQSDDEQPDEPEFQEGDNHSPTAEDIVSASLASGALSEMCEIAVSHRSLDDQEEARVRAFVDKCCECDNGPAKTPCSMLFPVEHYRSLRATFTELSHDELDLLIMGQVMAHTYQSPMLQGHHTRTPAERKKTYGQFFHQGQRVCQQTFLFLHNIGLKRFKNIKSSYIKTGPVPRVHGNTGKQPKHHLTLQQIKDVVQYILTYAGITLLYMSMHLQLLTWLCTHVTEANAMVLPGRVPGYKSSDIQLLPTKHQVWELYQQAASRESMRPVSYSTFTSLWRQLVPHVVVMKPMSDLCWQCQKNSTAITRSANRPEEEKTSVCNYNIHCANMYVCVRDRERCKERERERQKEKEGGGEIERQKEKKRERGREREERRGEREREREREMERRERGEGEEREEREREERERTERERRKRREREERGQREKRERREREREKREREEREREKREREEREKREREERRERGEREKRKRGEREREEREREEREDRGERT